MRTHEIRLLHLATVVRPGLRIAASCALSRLGISPRKIFVAVLLVAFSFRLVVAQPLARYLAAVRHIVANFLKMRDWPCLQHDRQC